MFAFRGARPRLNLTTIWKYSRGFCFSGPRRKNQLAAPAWVNIQQETSLQQQRGHEKSTFNGCVAFSSSRFAFAFASSSLDKYKIVVRHARVQSRSRKCSREQRMKTAESCVLAMNGRGWERDAKYFSAVAFAWFYSSEISVNFFSLRFECWYFRLMSLLGE